MNRLDILNSFDVIEASISGEELEYVYVVDNKENRREINKLLRLESGYPMEPDSKGNYPLCKEYFKFIHNQEDYQEGVLDLSELVYTYLDDVEDLGFNFKTKQWEYHMKEKAI